MEPAESTTKRELTFNHHQFLVLCLEAARPPLQLTVLPFTSICCSCLPRLAPAVVQKLLLCLV